MTIIQPHRIAVRDSRSDRRRSELRLIEDLESESERIYIFTRLLIDKGFTLAIKRNRGVLEDTCLVGGRGRPQKALSRIPFPKPVAGDTLVVQDLFSRDPMTFTRIKEDGDAVLKLYFVKKKTGKGPDTLANSGAGNDTSYFRVIGSSYPSVIKDKLHVSCSC